MNIYRPLIIVGAIATSLGAGILIVAYSLGFALQSAGMLPAVVAGLVIATVGFIALFGGMGRLCFATCRQNRAIKNHNAH